MNYTIVIKSNSHYKYLWNIINDFTKNLSRIIFFVDRVDDFIFNNNVEILYYDQELSYSDRVYYLTENIDTDYFVLIHDVDLVLDFKEDKLKEYLNLVEENNIDRLSLGVFNSSNNLSNGLINICRLLPDMSRNFLTPFDYAPSIYRTKTISNFYKLFSGVSYKELELKNEVQNYFYNNLLSYGIQKSDDINLVYHRGFVYTSDFNFLHITVAGNLLKDESYFDLKDRFIDIRDKYGLGFIPVMKSGYIQKNEI